MSDESLERMMKDNENGILNFGPLGNSAPPSFFYYIRRQKGKRSAKRARRVKALEVRYEFPRQTKPKKKRNEKLLREFPEWVKKNANKVR